MDRITNINPPSRCGGMGLLADVTTEAGILTREIYSCLAMLVAFMDGDLQEDCSMVLKSENLEIEVRNVDPVLLNNALAEADVAMAAVAQQKGVWGGGEST